MPAVPERHSSDHSPAEISEHSSGHRLGPHVVGTRIVVRHLLPDGRASDVLGVCLSWGTTAVTVETERGTAEIPFADIVTGKPVPPRASVRNRIPVATAGRHVLTLLPRVAASALGEWVLRPDVTLALGDPGLAPGEAAQRVLTFHEQQRTPAVVRVQVDSAADREFAALGLTAVGPDTDFQVASLARALRATAPLLGRHTDGAVERPVRMTSERSEDEGSAVERSEHEEHVRAESGTASARAVLQGDWLGLYDLDVSTESDSAVVVELLAELLDWGGSQGATTAWVCLEASENARSTEAAAANRELFAALGFITHHTSRVRRAV